MDIDERKAYWDDRYAKEGKIWGDSPNKSALYALKMFKKQNIQKILIPGSGYGRHTKFYSENNYKVVGIEISEVAIRIAKTFDPKTTFINCSVMQMDIIEDFFDAIYCFNTLHLFLTNERKIFLKNCYDKLKSKGYVYFTVFSEKDPSFGKGNELEVNMFESKPRRPTHYFSEEDLIEHFKDFKIIKLRIIEEQENHGKIGPHIHILRFIFAQK